MLYPTEATTHAAFVKRVVKLMGKTGHNLPSLARDLGIADATLKNILYKETEPKLSYLIKMAEILQTTVEYLATSTGDGDDDSIMIPIRTPESLAAEKGFIPESLIDAKSPTRNYNTFPVKRILLKPYGCPAEACRLVMITSSGMSPELRIGQLCFVDARPQKLQDGVFILMIGNYPTVRRVQANPEGFLLIDGKSGARGGGGLLAETNAKGEIITPGIHVIGRAFAIVKIGAL